MFSRQKILKILHPHNTTVTLMQPKEVSLVWSGVNVTQDATQWVSIPCSTHGRKGYRLRLVLHYVEVAYLKMIRHAGEIGEMPRQHRVEGSAESPNLQQ